MKNIVFALLLLLISSFTFAQEVEEPVSSDDILSGEVLTGTIETGEIISRSGKCYKEVSHTIAKQYKEKRLEWHSQKFDIKKEILELMKEKTESRKDKLKRGELSSEIRKLNDEIWNINVSIALSYKNEYEDRYFAKKSQPKECK